MNSHYERIRCTRIQCDIKANLSPLCLSKAVGDSTKGSGCRIRTSQVVRATNSKLLGSKILEVSKKFRVELENTLDSGINIGVRLLIFEKF